MTLRCRLRCVTSASEVRIYWPLGRAVRHRDRRFSGELRKMKNFCSVQVTFNHNFVANLLLYFMHEEIFCLIHQILVIVYVLHRHSQGVFISDGVLEENLKTLQFLTILAFDSARKLIFKQILRVITYERPQQIPIDPIFMVIYFSSQNQPR